jgi:hypothetical protein
MHEAERDVFVTDLCSPIPQRFSRMQEPDLNNLSRSSQSHNDVFFPDHTQPDLTQNKYMTVL